MAGDFAGCALAVRVIRSGWAMLEKRRHTDSIVLIARRNCALSPRQLWQAFLAIAMLSLLIAAVCVLIGAWAVLPWTLLEISAVAVAFLLWGRHAVDGECITISPTAVVVEVFCVAEVTRHEFNPQWAQLVVTSVGRFGQRSKLALREQGRALEVGRHLGQAGRDALAREIRAALRGASNVALRATPGEPRR